MTEDRTAYFLGWYDPAEPFESVEDLAHREFSAFAVEEGLVLSDIHVEPTEGSVWSDSHPEKPEGFEVFRATARVVAVRVGFIHHPRRRNPNLGRPRSDHGELRWA